MLPDQEVYEALMAEEIAGQPDGIPRPPWLRYPQYDRYSIGWRMGAGEMYMLAWRIWAEKRTGQQLREELARFAPLPEEWADWIASSITS